MTYLRSNVLILFLCLIGYAQAQQQKDFNLKQISNVQIEIPDSVPSQYHQYNDVWGWTAMDGTEYAILGAGIGTVIYSLADPAKPEHIITVPGTYSRWRDFKTYHDYIYVVADEGDDGLLIIDMSQAPGSITWKNWKPDLELEGMTSDLRKCHNLHIDSCYAYLVGCNTGKGAYIIDLCKDPLNPEFVAATDPIYAHDAFAAGDRLYLSNLSDGFSIVDISDRSSPITLASQETSSDFTHNAWASDDRQFLFTTDERFRAYVDAYDISNPDDIKFLDRYRPSASEVQGAIPHNVHYLDGYLIISYYTDGVKVVDAHRPQNLIEVGSFDTYFFRDGSFGGHWGAYPFLPSGHILSSDRSTGLYVFAPNYQRASYLEGQITDSVTGSPLASVEVKLLSDLPGKDLSDDSGNYETGLADTGTIPVRYFLPGYQTKIQDVDLEAGEVNRQDIQLVPLQRVNISGRVVDEISKAPIEMSQVTIFNELYQEFGVTDADGNFNLSSYEGDFSIVAGKWGYIHNFQIEDLKEDLSDIELALSPGYRDDFIFDYGWTVSSSVSTPQRQQWQRGVPAYYIYDAEFANPDGDIEEDLGFQCYVTGLEGTSSGNLSDTSTLTSPIFNLTDYADPYVYYHTWFYDNGVNEADDALQIWLSNGTNQVLVETISESGSVWRPRSEIRVRSFLEPSANMQLILLGADVGSVHLYEAGLDAFSVTDGQTTDVNEWEVDKLVEVYPNPFSDQITIQSQENIKFEYRLFDVLGKEILRAKSLENLFSIELSFLKEGFYFLSFLQDGRVRQVEKILKS